MSLCYLDNTFSTKQSKNKKKEKPFSVNFLITWYGELDFWYSLNIKEISTVPNVASLFIEVNLCMDRSGYTDEYVWGFQLLVDTK